MLMRVESTGPLALPKVAYSLGGKFAVVDTLDCQMLDACCSLPAGFGISLSSAQLGRLSLSALIEEVDASCPLCIIHLVLSTLYVSSGRINKVLGVHIKTRLCL